MKFDMSIFHSPFIVQEISRSIASNPYLADLGAEAIARHLDALSTGTPVDLYGCGNLGCIMATRHATALQRHKTAFLTTDGEETTFHGFARRNLRDARRRPANHVFLLSHAFQAEMMENLKGIVPEKAVHTLVSVIKEHTNWSSDSLQTLLTLLQDSLASTIAAIEELARRKGKVVCLAVPRLPPHMPKIMNELHENGIGVVLFVECDALGKGTVHDLTADGYFDIAFAAQRCYVLELFLLSHLAPLHVIHSVIGSWANTALAFLVRHAGCPVVAEYLDFIQIVFDTEENTIKNFCRLPEIHAVEKQALHVIHTQADGILHKDAKEGLDAITALYGGYGPKRSLHYMPYCGKRFTATAPVEKLSQKTRRVHIVHAVSVVNNPLWHNYKPFYSQFQAARWLDSQDISFHLFNATDNTGKGYEDYLALQTELLFFKYNFGRPYAELRHLLPAYDYAWFVFDYSEATETELYRVTGIGSKIFTYIEAGLPILSIPCLTFQHEFIMDNGIGVAVAYEDIPHLSTLLRQVDYGKMQENIKKAQKTYSHEQNMPRLLSLYDQCQDKMWPRQQWPTT